MKEPVDYCCRHKIGRYEIRAKIGEGGMGFKSAFITSFAISRDGKIAAYRFSATRDIVLIKGFR